MDKEFFKFTPSVLPEALRPMLAAADLFVFPSLIEGSSRSAMEAAAAGLQLLQRPTVAYLLASLVGTQLSTYRYST